jgi:hypothetical protein
MTLLKKLGIERDIKEWRGMKTDLMRLIHRRSTHLCPSSHRVGVLLLRAVRRYNVLIVSRLSRVIQVGTKYSQALVAAKNYRKHKCNRYTPISV